ncbi:MAG: hypothetical protein ABIF77_17285, partial [bacterium]
TEFIAIFNSLPSYPLHIEALCAAEFQQQLLAQASLTPGLSHFFDMLLTVPPQPVRRSPLTRFFDTVYLRDVDPEEQDTNPLDASNQVYSVPAAEHRAGYTFRELQQKLEERGGVTVIGYLQWEGEGIGIGRKTPVVTLNPTRRPQVPGQVAPVDYRLLEDDELFIIARPECYTALRTGRVFGNQHDCPSATRGPVTPGDD